MTDRIAFTRPDGGTSIMIPAPGVSLDDLRVPNDATNVTRIDSSTLGNRVFRDAWVVIGSAVACDMPKARTIHMDRIRVERNKELDRLDKEHAKETGRGRTPQAAAIEGQREILRNIPQTFDLSGATTDDELNALWPAGVPR